MVQYLSDEWIERAGEALASEPTLRAATSGSQVTLAYDVSGGPEGRRSYTLRMDHGQVSLEPGVAQDVPVTFALDYATAADIARGELSPQVAFMRGDLKLTGDATVLLRDAAVLDGVADALASVRSETEY